MENAADQLEAMKAKHRERSKRYYAKKRQIDDDVSSVESQPQRQRQRQDDADIPYEVIREAVYKAIDERPAKKSSVPGYAAALIGFGGLLKAVYEYLPMNLGNLGNLNIQSFLPNPCVVPAVPSGEPTLVLQRSEPLILQSVAPPSTTSENVTVE